MPRCFVLLGITFAIGCSGGSANPSESDCTDGTQGCLCYRNGSCDAGLECQENICEAFITSAEGGAAVIPASDVPINTTGGRTGVAGANPTNAVAGRSGTGTNNTMGGAASSAGHAGNLSAGGTSSDGSSGGSSASTSCISAGNECSETARCCNDSTCIVTPENVTLCAGNCETGADCNSGCCAPLRSGARSVCSPASYCAPPPAAPTQPSGCGDLIIIAEDGEFLGIATGNEFASDGVCNEFSSYGSEFSSTSIFNQFSTYGSEFSSQSAYSPYTSTPPILFCQDSGEAVAYVTKNQTLSPRVDPDALCAILEKSGI